MSVLSRFVLGAFIVFGVIVFAVNFTFAQGNGNPRAGSADMKHPLLLVEEKAIAAADDDPDAIQAFIDEIFAQSLFASSAPSVKGRVFKNERAFRAGEQLGISEHEIVDAINTKVLLANLPKYMRMNKGQFHAHRQHLRTYVRHYSKSDPTRGKPPDVLSPAEVIFVTAHLILQKLHNPQFRVEPEQWEKDAANRRAEARRAKLDPQQLPKSRFDVKPMDQWLAPIIWALPNESGEVVSEIHAFLDAVAFQR